jgi:nucleotide-binding universal stress UspA family protein
MLGRRAASSGHRSNETRESPMPYATIMVSLALNTSNDGALHVAAELAGRFGSRVIGISAADFSPPLYYTSGEAAQALLDRGLASIRNRMTELEAEFGNALHARCREIEWRSAVQQPSAYIARKARAADLVISGGTGPGAMTDPFAQADPADLVMQLGRPLLVVPAGAARTDLGSVLVAWKDTPEARRAIVDALPLLRQAVHITIAEIVEAEEQRPAALAGVNDVVSWLSHHGIIATAVVPDEVGHVSVQLDRLATRLGIGVVVAGAYGHSRFREWVLGGVTQHLITQTDRCALLSR